MARVKVGKRRKPMMVTHKDEKKADLRVAMQWLLDFLNKDIESLSPLECGKLLFDFAHFIAGSIFYEFLAKMLMLTPQKRPAEFIEQRAFLKNCQDILRRMFDSILMAEKRFRHVVGENLEGEHPAVPIYPYWIQYRLRVTKDRVFKEPFYDLEMFPFVQNHGETGEKMKTLLTGMLIDALVGIISPFPLSRIKTCQKPGCGNYFYQKTTKSKGDFCSPKCQNWARSNRWRKANPDKYNAYHRNRRSKAKEDQFAVKCRTCRFQQSLGSIQDLIHGILSDMNKCPTCGETLLHFIQTWENGKWMESESLGSFEWEEFLRKETQKGGD